MCKVWLEWWVGGDCSSWRGHGMSFQSWHLTEEAASHGEGSGLPAVVPGLVTSASPGRELEISGLTQNLLNLLFNRISR